MTDRPEMKRAIKHDKPSSESKRMIAMLDERQRQIGKMSDARYAKMEVENEIVITLLRDNDHSCITVNWNKLYRNSGWGRT